MTVTTAATNGPTFAGQATDWWYVRAYPGGPGRMDAAVRAALPWLADLAAELEAPAWHFLRFWDATGHHLRLRIRCTPAQADALHAGPAMDALRALMRGLPDEPESGLLPAEPSAVPRDQPCGVSPAPYAPERAKYGGTEGIARAEEVFTDCCAMLAETGLAALPTTYERAAAAVALTQLLVGTCLDEEEAAAFWAAHRRRWLPRLRLAVPAEETRERLNALAAAVSSAPRPEGPARERMAQHAHRLATSLDAPGKAAVSVPRDELLLHHVHMTHNRLGFPPPQEAALTLVAQALTKRQPEP